MTQTTPKMTDRVGGRVTFVVTYETLATVAANRRLYRALVGCEKFKLWSADDLLSVQDVSAFSTLLAHTVDLELSDDAKTLNHPELNALRDFWAWWLGERNKPVIDADALLDWRVSRLGFWTMRAWDEAFGKAQVPELSSPRELLPDAALTDEERADPS